MKKALTITLNNLVFYIEEDAYLRLGAYLESIKKTFAASSDKDEILADIEARIAERFTSATKEGKQAVTLLEVEALIQTMGTSEDIASTEPTSGEQTTQEGPRRLKKLYRDTDNRIVAGVASGLAAYFGIEALLVRVLFVLFGLFSGGFGIAVYILLWIVVPEAQTLSQKMEMQGDPVTLKNLEEAVKARMQTERDTHKEPAGRAAEFFNQLFALIGRALRRVAPVLHILIGGIFVILGTIGFIGATIAIIGFLMNAPHPSMDPEFIRFMLLIGERYFGAVVAAAYTIVIVPVSLLLLAGLALLRKKRTVSAGTVATLMALWIGAIIIIGVMLTYVIPRFEPSIYGSHAETIRLEHELKRMNRIHDLEMRKLDEEINLLDEKLNAEF